MLGWDASEALICGIVACVVIITLNTLILRVEVVSPIHVVAVVDQHVLSGTLAEKSVAVVLVLNA